MVDTGMDLTSVEALTEYIDDHKDQLITKLLYGFPTADIVSVEENVKGSMVLTNMVVKRLVSGYKRKFTPSTGLIKFAPRILRTYDAGVDMEVIPKDYEGSYMRKYRKKGQDPHDWPFEAEIFDALLNKIGEENEEASWQGEMKDEVDQTPDDWLIEMIDGFHHILADEVALGNLSPVITGVITNENAVASIRNLYKSLAPQYQMGNMDLFINPGDEILYLEDYQTRHGTTAQAFQNGKTMHLDIGDINIYKSAGIKRGAPVMMPKELMYIGFDDLNDSNFIHVMKQIKHYEISIMYKIGTQLALIDNGLIAINEFN